MSYASKLFCVTVVTAIGLGGFCSAMETETDLPRPPKDCCECAQKPKAAKKKDAATAVAENAADAAEMPMAVGPGGIVDASKKVALTEADLRAAIRKLATPGWVNARATLIEGGRASVPLLIEALNTGEGETGVVAAFNLGGHTKWDTNNAARQRPLSEVCAEILTDMVTNHTNYKGELPALDAYAWHYWAEWWKKNAAEISFGQ